MEKDLSKGEENATHYLLKLKMKMKLDLREVIPLKWQLKLDNS